MIAALIIAAGRTTHRESFEPQKEIGTIPAIQRIVKTFQQADIERIVIVCNEDDGVTEKHAARMNAVFLHNRRDAEMLDNVKKGLLYLEGKCTAALITHVDIPLFSVETVRALSLSEMPISIPSYQGTAGHPILIQSAFFDAIRSYAGAGGLAGAVESSGLERGFVDVDDAGIRTNVRYDDDYDTLLSAHNLATLHPDVRIRLAKEKPFYGAGPHQILVLIDETSSLSEACRQMGISYNKGRSILALIEQQLGFAATEGRSGGKDGGSSVLTKEGRALMQSYVHFSNEVQQCISDIFEKHFHTKRDGR